MKQGWLYTTAEGSGARGDVLALSADAFNEALGKALVVPIIEPAPELAEKLGGFYVELEGGKVALVDSATTVDIAGWKPVQKASPVDFGLVVATFRAILDEYQYKTVLDAPAEATTGSIASIEPEAAQGGAIA